MNSSMSTIRPESHVVVSMGDPAGIGPEIVVQCFRQGDVSAANCVVVGLPNALQRAQASILARCPGALPMPIVESAEWDEAVQAPPGSIPVWVPPGLGRALPDWGQACATGGRAAAACVREAARLCLVGQAKALVTAPIHKAGLAAAGELFPGHTEMLQALAAQFLGQPIEQVPVRMMLANTSLRTVLCSIHVSLREAIEAVRAENILATLVIADNALGRWLGRRPHLAVAGLNPHAGEGGLFGREEIEHIEPAIARARDMGLLTSGPWPPDTVFMNARADRSIDAVIAMYHDQGLIPIKYLGLEDGVNVTLGLPFVRSSPDHGTAYDIAGKGIADHRSMTSAIAAAHALAAGQITF